MVLNFACMSADVFMGIEFDSRIAIPLQAHGTESIVDIVLSQDTVELPGNVALLDPAHALALKIFN